MDMETMKPLLSSDSLVREVSLGGRTIDGNVQFFYALIAMACLYGCFIGFGSAIGISQYHTSGSQTVCNADPQAEVDPYRPADIFCSGLYGRDHFDPVSPVYS